MPPFSTVCIWVWTLGRKKQKHKGRFNKIFYFTRNFWLNCRWNCGGPSLHPKQGGTKVILTLHIKGLFSAEMSLCSFCSFFFSGMPCCSHSAKQITTLVQEGIFLLMTLGGTLIGIYLWFCQSYDTGNMIHFLRTFGDFTKQAQFLLCS